MRIKGYSIAFFGFSADSLKNTKIVSLTVDKRTTFSSFVHLQMGDKWKATGEYHLYFET